MRRILTWVLLGASGCATIAERAGPPFEVGSQYVAMGSSYAAGAGIGELVPDTPQRCGRTINNYARLLAARLRLNLVDASCGGATTAHILGRWDELPAQIDAVTQDTRLVTVTIGGNDVSYVRNLMTGMCGNAGFAPPIGRGCPAVVPPPEADWTGLELRLRAIARTVKKRAPDARLVFVDYLRIIPDEEGCAKVPLAAEPAAASRVLFQRLAAVTARIAREEGAMLLPAGELSKGHEACSADPWAAGYPAKGAPWHPTAEGHAAIADALAQRLSAQ